MFRDDFDGPSAYRQRSIDLPFSEIQSRQIVQAVRNIKMVGAERLFPNRQGALVERLGFGIVAFLPIELRQIVEAVRNIRMVGAQRLVADRQRAFVERLSFGVKVLGPVELGETI